MRVVATAGHVDHGKSSLVLALTGTDPDRFPEEKARGMTIDLGFAFASLPSGRVAGFVDVPGHVRFAKNMLAGTGAVDVALLVVAANEGWMPQTEEHRQVLELLDVRYGVVALTKTSLVDEELAELAGLDVAEHLAGSPLAAWPVVAVDSVTGAGVDDVRRALDDVLDAAPPPRDAGRPRLWVDRVFSARGAGTVVTGTLTGGSLHVDDEVAVEPGGRRARVRAVESHHERLRSVGPGSRVALNLAGIDHHEVRRGDAVVLPGQWLGSDAVDVALLPIDGAAFPRRGLLRAHVGSGEHETRFRALDDAGRFARLRFRDRLPLAPGDRVVLRSSGRRATVGGAEVLDVAPARRSVDAVARLALPLEERILRSAPWLTEADLLARAGIDAAAAHELATAMVDAGTAARAGEWIVAAPTIDALREEVRSRVVAHHRTNPAARGLDLAVLASSLDLDVVRLRGALEGVDDIVITRDVVRHRDHTTSVTDHPDARRFLDALEAAPFSPPSPASLGVDPAIVRDLGREGAVVELDGIVFSAASIDEARRIVADAVVAKGSLSVADVRDLLGSSRKYVLSIVHHLDARGVTRRRGDDRVPGPRAADP